MTDLRTAVQQALEALGKFSIGYHVDAVELNDLIATLEAALEQPEPVALAWSNLEGTKFVGNGEKWKHKDCVVPLYTHPANRNLYASRP